MSCPSKALFCGEKLVRIELSAQEEWRVAKYSDIVLDTGCSRTIVRSSFVPVRREISRRTSCYHAMCSWGCSTVLSS